MPFAHRFETEVRRSADDAWAAATSIAGIRSELSGILRLRTSPSITTLEELLELDRPILVTLAVGPLPVVRWRPRVEVLDEVGMRFVESADDMTGLRLWRHDRRVVATGADHCRVIDVVSGDARVPGAGALVAAMFRGRHRRLRRRT